MGYNSTASTKSLTAKLTPYGRQQLLVSTNELITHFAFGDSDANYNAALPLETGEVPSSAGNLGPNGNTNNSVANGFSIKSSLYANTKGDRKKAVKEGSTNIVSSIKALGQNIVSGTSLTQDIVNRTDYSTDSLVNLIYSFSLPITEGDKTLFSATTFEKGGYADTALSGISQDDVLIIGVDTTQYGEMFDGKTVKVDLTTTASTSYTLYSTFESTLTKTTVQDANVKETSFNSAIFGNNIAFLFSDDIQKPNNDVSKSWATGYNTTKPFSLNRKSQFNMTTNSATSTVADKAVGIAFLDKGFIVVTEPTIVADFDPTHSTGTGTSVTFDSVVTEVTQEVTCIADRGEFGTSNNPTFSSGDVPRISEVVLLDAQDNIIAVGKTDRHFEKQAQSFLALSIKITV